MTRQELRQVGTARERDLGLQVPAPDNAGKKYLDSLADSTRYVAEKRLRRLLEGMDPECAPWPELLRYEKVSEVRGNLLKQGLSYGTVNVYLSDLRGIANQARRLRQITAEELEDVLEIKPVKGSRLPPGRALSAAEFVALADTCARDNTPRGRRDDALLGALYSTGARREELVNLNLADYDQATGLVKIIQGKGRKDRIVAIVNGARRALGDWLKIRGDGPGPLFLAVNRGGKIGTARLTAQTVYDILDRLAESTGIAAFRPHDMRRSCLTSMMTAGVPMAQVSRYAGHANPATTAGYLRTTEAEMIAAAGTLNYPHVDRGHRQDAGSWTGSK